jgi:hypothetical protein
MPSAETDAMAIVNRLNMTISRMIAEHLSAILASREVAMAAFKAR